MTVPTVLPEVAVFSLGGTIASTADPGSADQGVTPRLGAEDLIAAVPQLRYVAQVTAVPFRRSASGDLTLEDMIELTSAISARFDSGAAGVVVTQGTDTIEETSFALDLLVPGERPVVVTGAMRNPTLPGADGPANLLAAVQVAASPQAEGMGCLVVLNDQIHAARFVRKTHTSSPSTFASVTAGPVGWVVEGRPHLAFRPVARLTLPPVAGPAVPAVALLTVCLSDDGRLLEQAELLGYAGLVLEAFGGGHVPARLVPALERLAVRMPVVLSSRTGGGEVLRETYGFAGSERDLLARGLLPAGALDGLKARVLLSLLLASRTGTEDVRRAFADVIALV